MKNSLKIWIEKAKNAYYTNKSYSDLYHFIDDLLPFEVYEKLPGNGIDAKADYLIHFWENENHKTNSLIENTDYLIPFLKKHKLI